VQAESDSFYKPTEAGVGLGAPVRGDGGVLVGARMPSPATAVAPMVQNSPPEAEHTEGTCTAEEQQQQQQQEVSAKAASLKQAAAALTSAPHRRPCTKHQLLTLEALAKVTCSIN
jgi:hypothetical protein